MIELVALYARVSTQEQALEGYSIHEQQARMESYCNAMGWKIYKTYVDAGFSGANTDRPALQRMIKDVRAKRVSKVLVYKLDRLSRAQKDTLQLIEDVFLANGIDFVSMSENFDTSTPFGRAIVGILAVFAQLEREQIKERMIMGKDARAKQGLFNGGMHVPVGYKYNQDSGELETDEFGKMIVKLIFEKFNSGLSAYKIAKQLNDSGLIIDNKWSDERILRIIRNRVYIGQMPHKGQWHKGNHEPFFTEDYFNAVQRLDALHTKAHLEINMRAGLATTYLSGFLVCAHCGAKYSKVRVYSTNGKAYDYYKCASRHKKNQTMIKDPNCKNKHWRMEELDGIVFDCIRKLAVDPRYLAEVKQTTVEDKSIDVLEGEKTQIEKRLNRLMDLYESGEIPLDMLQQRIHDLSDRKSKLEGQIEALNDESEKRISTAETIKLVQSFGDVLKYGNLDEIRTVIGALIQYIELDNDDVIIHWNFN